MRLNKLKTLLNRYRWQFLIGFLLVAMSAVAYLAQILIFHKSEDTFFYMLQDFAFVPIQVLLVTIILNEILVHREKEAIKGKLNMVIGSFFSEMGTALLKILASYDANHDAFMKVFSDNSSFSDRNFGELRRYLRHHEYRIRTEGKDLPALKQLLMEKRDCMMRLLENPNLLEHETFTDLLWAVSHLSEEFSYREGLSRLTAPDRRHLEGDIARAYNLLTQEWLSYVRHLRDHYPYMFSLVVRINPFDPKCIH